VFVAPEVLTADEERSVRGVYKQAGAFNVALFNYAVRYLGDHPGLKVGFAITNADLTAFYRALPEWNVTVDRDDFRGARRFVRYQLEKEIANQAWGQRGEFLQELPEDHELSQALALLRSARTQKEVLAEAERLAPPVPAGATSAAADAQSSADSTGGS